MRDVAKAAGVSQAAVSYAYSESPRVSPQVRERIFAAANEIGYTGPNVAGSSLRLGRIGTVGILVPGSLSLAVEDPSTMLLMKGIAEVGEMADVALTLLSVDGAGVADETRPTKPAALRGLVDGVVMHSLPNEHPVVSAMVSRRMPAVAIDSPRLPTIPYVTIDHRAGGVEQMNHVLRLRHRRIGVITDRLGTATSSQFHRLTDGVDATETYIRERFIGYLAACTSAGLPVEDVTVVEAPAIDMASGMLATRKLLAQCDPSAIVATSDVHAAAAVRVLSECGKRVPLDVSVIGFDDAPLAELIGLTTVRQPLVEKGRAAATMLLDVLAGQNRRRSVKRFELIVRSTTGPAMS